GACRRHLVAGIQGIALHHAFVGAEPVEVPVSALSTLHGGEAVRFQGIENLAAGPAAIFQGGVPRRILRSLVDGVAPAPVAVGRDSRPWTRSWRISLHG